MMRLLREEPLRVLMIAILVFVVGIVVVSAGLAVSRPSVDDRLKAIERKLGIPLNDKP